MTDPGRIIRDNVAATTGPVRRNRCEWALLAFVATVAGVSAMVLLRGPELLRWACWAWDAGP